MHAYSLGNFRLTRVNVAEPPPSYARCGVAIARFTAEEFRRLVAPLVG